MSSSNQHAGTVTKIGELVTPTVLDADEQETTLVELFLEAQFRTIQLNDKKDEIQKKGGHVTKASVAEEQAMIDRLDEPIKLGVEMITIEFVFTPVGTTEQRTVRLSGEKAMEARFLLVRGAFVLITGAEKNGAIQTDSFEILQMPSNEVPEPEEIEDREVPEQIQGDPVGASGSKAGDTSAEEGSVTP